MGTRFPGTGEPEFPGVPFEELRFFRFQFFAVKPGIFRAVPVENLRFFWFQPGNMPAVSGRYSGSD